MIVEITKQKDERISKFEITDNRVFIFSETVDGKVRRLELSNDDHIIIKREKEDLTLETYVQIFD